MKEERTFDYVTLDYHNIPLYIAYNLPIISNTSVKDDSHYTLYELCMFKLMKIKVSTLRALEDMAQV